MVLIDLDFPHNPLANELGVVPLAKHLVEELGVGKVLNLDHGAHLALELDKLGLNNYKAGLAEPSEEAHRLLPKQLLVVDKLVDLGNALTFVHLEQVLDGVDVSAAIERLQHLLVEKLDRRGLRVLHLVLALHLIDKCGSSVSCTWAATCVTTLVGVLLVHEVALHELAEVIGVQALHEEILSFLVHELDTDLDWWRNGVCRISLALRDVIRFLLLHLVGEAFAWRLIVPCVAQGVQNGVPHVWLVILQLHLLLLQEENARFCVAQELICLQRLLFNLTYLVKKIGKTLHYGLLKKAPRDDGYDE